MGALGLPPIPPELRSVTAFIQRADELSAKEPVIAYWCAYHAAQHGISLKLKDPTARKFLFEILDLLERMKADLGANDAIHDEAASAAYVENFALRVFAAADNEDRRGEATRGTAKKFLAAANFLELLRVFDKEQVVLDLPNIEEKIRYAKWKAADIAKAFREGRTPAPGPAGSEPGPDPPSDPNPSTPPASATPASHPQNTSPPAITRSAPPPPQLTHLTPGETGLAPPVTPQAQGTWSTVATPGTPGHFFTDEDAPSGGSEMITPPASASPRNAHFSSSVVGGVSPGAGASSGIDDPFSVQVVVDGPATFEAGLPSAPTLPPPPPPASFPPPPSFPASPVPPPVPPPSLASPAPAVYQQPTINTAPPKLTPQLVARAQKHCKFAISALDYEDSTQAIKELRAALKLLEG